MPIEMKQRRAEAGYALQVAGEREECGLSENVYRFEACLAGKAGQPDLSTIHGLLIHHDGSGDFYIKLKGASDDAVRYKSVETLQGVAASEMIQRGVDLQVRVRGEDLLFLHTPRVLDINAQREPGTRLISALQKHFFGRNLAVVMDLGIDEESEEFEDYFFPDLYLLGLHSQPSLASRDLKHGSWGMANSTGKTFVMGVDYNK